MARSKFYINDFCEDLNHTNIILYIGNVDIEELRKMLDADDVNKLYRLDYATQDEDPSKKDFIYISNCDLQNLDFPVYEYVKDEGYVVCPLHQESNCYYLDIDV